VQTDTAHHDRGHSLSRHRLAGFDYADPDHAYFLTICSRYNTAPFTDARLARELVASLDWLRANRGLLLYAWCLMPDHLHLLLRPSDRQWHLLIVARRATGAAPARRPRPRLPTRRRGDLRSPGARQTAHDDASPASLAKYRSSSPCCGSSAMYRRRGIIEPPQAGGAASRQVTGWRLVHGHHRSLQSRERGVAGERRSPLPPLDARW